MAQVLPPRIAISDAPLSDNEIAECRRLVAASGFTFAPTASTERLSRREIFRARQILGAAAKGQPVTENRLVMEELSAIARCSPGAPVGGGTSMDPAAVADDAKLNDLLAENARLRQLAGHTGTSARSLVPDIAGDASGDRMSAGRRDELLALTTAGRSMLAKDRQRIPD